MGDPTWGDIMQLGVVGPIVWLLYRTLPMLAKVGEAFVRLEERIEAHEQKQAELMRLHEERSADHRAAQQRWMDYMLRRQNGKDAPVQGQ